MSSTAGRLHFAPIARAQPCGPASIVQCSTASGLEALQALGPDWQALEAEAGENWHLFQSYAWCMHWARAASTLRGQRNEIRIVTVRALGRLVLVWPLEIKHGTFFSTATWLGEPLTQYGDVIAAKGLDRAVWLKTAWNKILSFEDVDVLWLRRVRGDAVIKTLLEQNADQLPDRQEALSLDMTSAENWDQIQGRFKTKLKKNRKRHRRRLSDQGTLHFLAERHSPQALAIAEHSIELKQLWIEARGLANNPFKDPVYTTALWSMVRGDEPRVRCQVFAHELNGRATATDIAFQFKDRHYAHIAAMDLAFESFGPGNVLTEDVLQHTFEQGDRIYDLMAPAAGYKEDWTDTRVDVLAFAKPLSLKGWLFCNLYLRRLRPWLKELAARLPSSISRLIAKA